MWEAIQYVTGGFTLVAFIAAVAALTYKGRTDERERIIRSATEKERSKLVRDALEFFNVDTSRLTKEQQADIALAQIHARSQRYGQAAWVTSLVAVLLSLLAAFAIYRPDPSPQPKPTTGATLVVSTQGPITIPPGKAHTIPLSLTEKGEIEVMLQRLTPDWEGFEGQKGLPGQDGLLVRICSSRMEVSCPPGRQVGLSQPFSRELPAGSASISLFNFASSPPMTVTLRIKHPQ